MRVVIKQKTPLKFKLANLSDLKEEQFLLLEPEQQLNLENVNKTKGHLETDLFAFPLHWEIVEQGVPNVTKASNPQAIKRQIQRLTRYFPPDRNLDLSIPSIYADQRDNLRDSWRTCNTSANAMYLDWLLRVIGKKGLGVLSNGTLNDNEYLRTVFTIGDSPQHWVQTQAIKKYGFNTKWMTDRDLPFVKDLLNTGFPVVTNILHKGSIKNPHGGHVITLIGYRNNTFTCHDPWGTLSSAYTNHNGKFSKISENEFIRRWQGGYRTLA